MEGWLVSGGQQSLPVLILYFEPISFTDVHGTKRYHGDIVPEMANNKIGVPTHETLNAIEGNLTAYLNNYLHNLVSKELAGTVLT